MKANHWECTMEQWNEPEVFVGWLEWRSEGEHGGSHLARHHCSGEQLVELNQLVGSGVKLERNAVQRVPRFHLDRKTRERTETSLCCSCSEALPSKLHRPNMKMGHTPWSRQRKYLKSRALKRLLYRVCVLHGRTWNELRLKLLAVDQEKNYAVACRNVNGQEYLVLCCQPQAKCLFS